MLRLPPNARRHFQIGPRVRVGGTLGHIGQKVKQILPSPGASIGGALGGAGGYLVGSGAGSELEGKGLTGNLKPDLIKGGAILAAGAGAAAAGAGAGAGAGGGAGVIGSLVDHGKNLLGGAVDAMGGGNGLIDKSLMAAAIAQTAADRQKQAGMIDEATKYAKDSYNERAPLRTQALGTLTDPGSPANHASDLSSIYANQGGVYDQQRRGTLGSRVPVGGVAQ